MNRKGSIALVSLLCLCALVSGCRSGPPDPITIQELPAIITYNDTSFSLEDASFCEVYTDDGYIRCCVVTVGRSGVSDNDIYQALNEGITAEFTVNAYLTIGNDFKQLSEVLTTYDNECIYFLFCSTDVQREPLNDFELAIQLITSPENKITADTTQYYYYYINPEDGVDYSDYDNMLSETERNLIIDAIN